MVSRSDVNTGIPAASTDSLPNIWICPAMVAYPASLHRSEANSAIYVIPIIFNRILKYPAFRGRFVV